MEVHVDHSGRIFITLEAEEIERIQAGDAVLGDVPTRLREPEPWWNVLRAMCACGVFTMFCIGLLALLVEVLSRD